MSFGNNSDHPSFNLFFPQSFLNALHSSIDDETPLSYADIERHHKGACNPPASGGAPFPAKKT
jgi:hypothetical protein